MIQEFTVFKSYDIAMRLILSIIAEVLDLANNLLSAISDQIMMVFRQLADEQSSKCDQSFNVSLSCVKCFKKVVSLQKRIQCESEHPKIHTQIQRESEHPKIETKNYL